MATIRSRGSKFHVQVRKIGYPAVTKTFSSISVAKQWAKITEADMERRLHVVIPDDTTVEELLDRYETEIVPTHKGHRDRGLQGEDSEKALLKDTTLPSFCGRRLQIP